MNIQQRPKKILRKVLIIALAVGIVFAAIAAFIVTGLTGGIKNVILNHKPAPNTNSSSFINKKNQARDNIRQSFASLESITGLRSYGSSSKDACEVGQNNYKVHDGYAHQCTYRTSKFYGLNGDFRQNMIDFEQKILNDGWNDTGSPGCTHCTIKGVITNYYDNPKQALGSPQYLPPEPAPYTKGDYNLDIMYGYKNVLQDDFFGYYPIGPDNHDQKDFRDGLAAALIDNQYVFVVSIQQVIFQN